MARPSNAFRRDAAGCIPAIRSSQSHRSMFAETLSRTTCTWRMIRARSRRSVFLSRCIRLDTRFCDGKSQGARPMPFSGVSFPVPGRKPQIRPLPPQPILPSDRDSRSRRTGGPAPEFLFHPVPGVSTYGQERQQRPDQQSRPGSRPRTSPGQRPDAPAARSVPAPPRAPPVAVWRARSPSRSARIPRRSSAGSSYPGPFRRTCWTPDFDAGPALGHLPATALRHPEPGAALG
jgi:hypothetical protein